ncbi:hypothetical protein HYS49_01465 [Candidatus Woesearchaeota archaeon]|nr:hypothetical protein [Candidatus Woesearchaeota archaeon]
MCVLYLGDDPLIEEVSLEALLALAREHGFRIVDLASEDTVNKYGREKQVFPLLYLERKQLHEQAVVFKGGDGKYVMKRYELPM